MVKGQPARPIIIIDMTIPNVRTFFVITLLLLISGCARLPGIGKTSIKASTLSELHGKLRSQPADLERFRVYGPFDVSRQDDVEINVPGAAPIRTDFFLSAHAEKAPLVIFLHGHDASKALHAYQALHVASWGMHGLTVQLPNNGPWDSNARALAQIVTLIYRAPEHIDRRIDINNIVLVGHSFGGAAVALALAEGAPAAGGILLDPAVTDSSLPLALRRIQKPLLILGADEKVSAAKDREYFFRDVRSGVYEVSVKGATHEDAQFPAEDSHTTEALQITFASAVTAAALSLTQTGKFDEAWASFKAEVAAGKLIGEKHK